jgi:sugar phosphate isomerase/epimerase
MSKKMKLGLHTYTLHLWGLGQNWGIVADPRPKAMNLLQLMDKAVEKLAPLAFCNHFCDHKLDRDQFGVRFHGVALGDGDIDCFKAYRIIREQSPTDRITFEIEWDMGKDSLDVAREKEMNACIRSIHYARNVLGIGTSY